MKNYKKFILELLSSNQIEITEKIINYLNYNTDYEYYPYDEEFEVEKKDINLIGKLFLMNDNRAIRINFDKNILHSIDLWEDFKFDDITIINKPVYTMLPKTIDIEPYLDDIVDFVNEDFEIYENIQSETQVKHSEDEEVKLKSLTISRSVLDKDIDVFDALQMYARQVIYGVSNSLIISGGAGLGKSTEIENILQESRMDYQFFKGDISLAGLYETLFTNNGELLVFDDIDNVWNDQASVNLLKAALDTKKEREVSRILKTHYDSKGMTYKEMKKIYDDSGKLPKQFLFTGRCIFITNIDGKDIDPAVISRSLHIDINLTKEQVIERLRKIIDKIFNKISQQSKEETLDFVDYLIQNYNTKFPLSIRTMVHALNIRMSNDGLTMDVGGEKVPTWQLLIKQFLVKK